MRNDRFEIDLFSWGELDPEIVPPSVVPKLAYKHLEFPVRSKHPALHASIPASAVGQTHPFYMLDFSLCDREGLSFGQQI